jgi:hypothetical protein
LFDSSGKKVYEGEWRDDKYHNFGTLYNMAPEGARDIDHRDLSDIEGQWLRYEGDFSLGIKHNFGMYYFCNDERFSGNFTNDQIHGYGTYFKRDGTILNGYWENN